MGSRGVMVVSERIVSVSDEMHGRDMLVEVIEDRRKRLARVGSCEVSDPLFICTTKWVSEVNSAI
jgi:hypothetical protein